VSNDAVNFLNSAIGSGVAKRRTVYWIAGVGIVLGTFISAGMMEVARNGIIYPDKFSLSELLTLFMAAMLVNIVLIDTFNTFKFPTSTTIAVVFELIGGALAITLIKQYNSEPGYFHINEIINTGKVLIILGGIVLSIGLSFSIGMVVQFITRLIFSFNYKNRYKVLLSIVGGLAITAITYMILKKSVNGIFIREDIWRQLLEQYLPQVLITVFAGTTFIFLFLSLSFDFDISRLVVLFGTFALALSFASNDLVNFIGLPLAGFESVKMFFKTGAVNPDTFSLDFLNDSLLQKGTFKDITQLLIFSISAGIMVVTLFYSKKARGVTETEIYLGRQLPGYERFSPSHLSRFIVKVVLKIHTAIMKYMPKGVVNFINSRYERSSIAVHERDDEIFYFDTLRAIVNLTMAGLLISLGTFLKFPLSTTFVVFMVAMGTSLADMAWGRDSAVYRISGVIYILGGWLLTAVLALLGSLILTIIIWFGGMWVVIPLLFLLFYILYKSTRFYRDREKQQIEIVKNSSNSENSAGVWLAQFREQQIKSLLIKSSKVYFLSLKSFIDNDSGSLQKTASDAVTLTKSLKASKSKLFDALVNTPDDNLNSGNLLVQIVDYLSVMVRSITAISSMLYNHLNNQHKGFSSTQKNELSTLLDEITTFFNLLIYVEKECRFDTIPELIRKQELILIHIENIRIGHLKKIKKGKGSTKTSVLFVELLAETKTTLLYSINFIRTYQKLTFSEGNELKSLS
jgi:phosphate/sulfate permease